MDGDIPPNGGYNPELPGKTWALNTAEKPLLWVPAMWREKSCPFSQWLNFGCIKSVQISVCVVQDMSCFPTKKLLNCKPQAARFGWLFGVIIQEARLISRV